MGLLVCTVQIWYMWNAILGSRSCHCNNTNVAQDVGYLRGRDTFPIRELLVGDTGDSNEWLYYTLGPLRCVVGKVMSYHASNDSPWKNRILCKHGPTYGLKIILWDIYIKFRLSLVKYYMPTYPYEERTQILRCLFVVFIPLYLQNSIVSPVSKGLSSWRNFTFF